MPKPVFRFALLLIFSSAAFMSTARAAAPLFRNYTQREGLADDYITAVAFAGPAIWVGTARGATTVQGQYWRTYTDANGLGNSWVSGIAAGSHGETYVATSGGGLAVFDGTTRKPFDTSNSEIPDNFLTAIAVDKQDRVWVGTNGAGIARLDQDVWTEYPAAPRFVNALALDASGNLWSATNAGACFFDGKQWTQFDQESGLAGNRVNAIAVAPDHRVWFATDKGVTVFDGKTFRSYGKTDGLADDAAQTIAIDAQGRIWVGTRRGLSMLVADRWTKYTRGDGLGDDEVTALAIDQQDNVWVGTTRGLAISGSSTLPAAPAPPVVLVHGWHTADSDQIDDTEFRFIKRYLEQDGIRVFYAAGISPHRTLFQNAATLRDDIAAVKAQTGAAQVDLLAFSMGGLNTRSYLESTLYQNDVRRAIILGTPEAGVRLWYPLLTRELEDRPTEPSAIELTPEYAALFNQTHTPPATVPYDLLIGDARSQPGLDLLKIFPPSDGLIDDYSALALEGPQVRHEVDDDVHAWDPAPLPLNIASYLYPDQTYQGYIRNALRDPDTLPIGPKGAAPAQAPVAPRNITPLNVDTLDASESLTHTVPIDANRATRFFAHWSDGDVDLKLRAPDGTLYTPPDSHGATYLKADIGSFAGYAISPAQSGNWSVVITRLDHGTELVTVTTYADLDADLQLNASTDHASYPLAAPVVISATLSDTQTDANVSAKIEWLGDGNSPRGAPTELDLTKRAPGVYTNTVVNLTRGGYYLVRVTAAGAGFARQSEIILAISPQTAAFAASPRVQVEGNPGRYSALAVDTQINAARAGAFALSATLHDASGRVVVSLTEPVTLTAGVQPSSIAIPGRDLRARGIEGPYTIDLDLMDASWAAILVDQQSHAVVTEAYPASAFEP